jgi:hypothetical protein
MNAMLAETVALLESLSRRAAELAAALPALDLGAEDLATLAGEVQRLSARLADAEERVAAAGPAMACRPEYALGFIIRRVGQFSFPIPAPVADTADPAEPAT